MYYPHYSYDDDAINYCMLTNWATFMGCCLGKNQRKVDMTIMDLSIMDLSIMDLSIMDLSIMDLSHISRSMTDISGIYY